jgi:hypothetical protein
MTVSANRGMSWGRGQWMSGDADVIEILIIYDILIIKIILK